MITTTIVLNSSTNPSTYGSAMGLSCTITPATSGAAMSGKVTFFCNGVALGSATVMWNAGPGTGTAGLSVSNLPGGSNSLTCSYSGDTNYNQSSSSVLTQTVNKTSAGLSLSFPSTSVVGQSVTFVVANSAPATGLLNPTGTVTFFAGGSSIGSAPLVPTQLTPSTAANAASLPVSNLALGSHTITASYSGDSNYSSTTLGPVSLTVNQASTTTVVSSSINPSALGQNVTFTAQVGAASPGSGTPTGTVTFLQGMTTIGTGTLSGGVATFSTSSLAQGSDFIHASYGGDSNFTSSTSSPITQVVNAAVAWVVTAAPAAPDPQQATLIPFGTAQVSPLTGALMRALPIDIDQHSACDCGCACSDNNRAGVAPLAVVYNSATVNVQPLFVVTLASDFTAAVPSQIQAQLTWNGTAQAWVTFATTGHSSGDVYSLPLQVSSAVGSSGIYPWSVEVKTTVGATVYTSTVSGVLPVVVNSGSAFGAGCALGGTQSLLIGTAGVALVDNSTGTTRYFVGTGPSYTSPANDQGTLVQNMGGSYTYTSKEQLQTNFDSSGRMTSQVDPHGLTQALAYSGSLLSTITQPDGAVGTLVYNGSNQLVSIQAAGGRLVTIGYDGSGNLNSFVDAANGLYTFAYDGSNRLVNEQVGPINTSYGYSGSGSTLNQINRGLGTTLAVTAAAVQGLGASTAINTSQAVAVLTDALSNTTSYTLDPLGRTTQVQTADGAVQSWALNSAGNPSLYTDQLNRGTAYAYNLSQDLTGITYPDGTMATMQYETTFHQVSQIEDALGHFTTNTYNGTTSDLLTTKDALGNVTTNTWSNGMMQTVEDPLGRVTTWMLDTSKRRQTGMIDALNNITTNAFDGAGNRISMEDALGHFTTWTFDGKRRLLTQTNALLGVQTNTWDALGNLLTTVDELGRTTSNTLDQRSLLVSTMEAVGTAQQRTTSNSYDVAGNLSYVTNALAEITSFGYDSLNRVIAQIEAFGSTVQRTSTTSYDLVGNILSTIDPRGTITSFAYDLLNRQTQLIEAWGNALQRTASTIFDAVGNVLSTTNPRGTITSFGYNANNWPTQLIEGYGTSLARTTSTVYNAVGNVLSVTNPIGAITSYAYDLLNRVTQLIEAYGSGVQRTTSTAFDPVGNVSFVTNPRGFVTSYAYDSLNRLVQQFDAFGNALQRTLTTVFDAVGNVLSRSNGLGVLTSKAYDSLNRLVTQLAAYGTGLQEMTTTVYDADDNVIATVDALDFITTYGLDGLNRQVTVENPDGGVASTVYDPNDNVVAMIDQLAHTTTRIYDVLNRPTQTIDARGGIVSRVYDANNNLVSLTDPVNNVTAWLYDLLDRQVRETDPLGNVATMAWDAGDRQTSTTDRLGQVIDFSYDLLNRETGESWYNAVGSLVNALTFTFDPNNNLLTAANNSAAVTTSYDALDRPSTVQSPFGVVLTNSYDPADNRTLMQDSQGGTTTFTVDALNRLATMQFSGNSATLREDFSYTARNQVATQTRYSNLAGTTTIGYSAFTQDSVGRLTNLVHQNGTGTTLAYFTNTYDLASRITAETLNGGTPTSYAYDTSNELTSDAVNSYSYDLNGNRTMAGYTTGPANEMTSDGTWDYFFDKNGNVIAKVNISTGEAWTFAYDNRNRLISALDVTSGLQMQSTYVYDARGKRIEKDVWTQTSGSTTTTRFASDGNEIWADLTSANALQMRYLRGSGVLELLGRVSSGGTVAWLLTDRMGSVRQVVDSTGALIDTITYDGYGNIASETNSTNGGNYKAFGYRVDSETGWLRPDPSTERYYSPATGRWLQADSIGFGAGDFNLYRYVGNNPANVVDPSGLVPWYTERYGIKVVDGGKLHDAISKKLFEDLLDEEKLTCDQLRELAKLIAKSNSVRGRVQDVGAGSTTHIRTLILENLLFLAILAAAGKRKDPCGGFPELKFDAPRQNKDIDIPVYVTQTLQTLGVKVQRPSKPSVKEVIDSLDLGRRIKEPTSRMPNVSPKLIDPYACIRCHPWDGRFNSPVPPPRNFTTTEKVIIGTAVVAVVVLVVVAAPVGVPAGGAVVIGKISATGATAAALLLAVEGNKKNKGGS